MNIAEIRKQYLLNELNEEQAGNNPMSFFTLWLQQAIESQVPEPTAMVLSTINDLGRPASRVVLLKECTINEFHFFTNYLSNKGRQLEGYPYASLLFFWKELERQVRIEGTVKKLSAEASDNYFKSRPFESRLGAIISPQSQVIPNRTYLEELFANRKAEINEVDSVARPEHWGGYAVTPYSIEFWQGRDSRLHDRIRFRRDNDTWLRERLAP